ncbi:2075_t:CDS:2, partial [Racocetra fulgida]
SKLKEVLVPSNKKMLLIEIRALIKAIGQGLGKPSKLITISPITGYNNYTVPIKDPIKAKEYARLSMLIKYARERGEDPTPIIEQRKSLINSNIIPGISISKTSIRNKGIRKYNIIPKSQAKNNIPPAITATLNQITLFQQEIRQHCQEQARNNAEILAMVSELTKALSNQKPTPESCRKCQQLETSLKEPENLRQPLANFPKEKPKSVKPKKISLANEVKVNIEELEQATGLKKD